MGSRVVSRDGRMDGETLTGAPRNCDSAYDDCERRVESHPVKSAAILAQQLTAVVTAEIGNSADVTQGVLCEVRGWEQK
jgi:hypothetical protein